MKSNKGYINFDLVVGLGGLALIAFLGIAIVVGIFGFPGGINPNYSDGVRAGVVTKLSHKGMVYKSWEGQMNMGGMTSVGEGKFAPTTFDFNVPDNLSAEIQTALDNGKAVKLTYHQYFISPVSIDSPYVIVKVEAVKQ